MAFEEVIPSSQPTRIPKDVAGVWFTTSKPTKTQLGGLIIYIGMPLVDKLGWLSTERLLVFEGTDKDTGFFAVEGAANWNDKAYKLIHGKSAIHVLVSVSRLKHYKVNFDRACQESVEFQAFGGRLLFIVPSWVSILAEPK